MTDFFEVVRARQSIRKFEKREVPIDKIEKMLDAARLAPSALNMQPWDFVVVVSPELKKELRAIYDRAREAMNLYKQDTSFVEDGTIIVACAHMGASRPVISTSLAIENLVLAATALDFGSVIMTAPVSRSIDREEVMELLKIPDDYKIVAFVVVGYSDEIPKPKPKKGLGEIVHINTFEVQ